MQHSWWTASTDVKQKIIQATDPETTRSLCRLDDETRQICQSRLPAEQKYRTCLKSKDDAAECDRIPMFSEQQFRALVPAMIEIYPQDKVQLTHEFYSQTYKLPEEGYATALRKAKLLNTICNISRLEFLVSDASKRLPMPAYLDTLLFDTLAIQYGELLTDEADPGAYLKIDVNLLKLDPSGKINLNLIYDADERDIRLGPGIAFMSVRRMVPADLPRFIEAVVQDEYLPTWMKSLARLLTPDYQISIPLRDNVTGGVNTFHLSRLLKILFDLGYYNVTRVETELRIVNGFEEVFSLPL